MKPIVCSISGADETVPRRISCVGTCDGGKVTMVLLPTLGRGALVWVKGLDVRIWQARKPTSAQFSDDLPGEPKPVRGVDAAAAAQIIADLNQLVPTTAGESSFRGRWTATLACKNGVPELKLCRKIATYTDIEVTTGGLSWTIKGRRKERWYAPAVEWGDSARPPQDRALNLTLKEACRFGRQLVGEACSARDTMQRAKIDTGPIGKRMAEKAASRAEKVKPDPIKRLPPPPAGSMLMRNAVLAVAKEIKLSAVVAGLEVILKGLPYKLTRPQGGDQAQWRLGSLCCEV